MKKVFQVAGHRFAITMPDGSPFWKEMKNYEPFVADDSGSCVFVAEMIDELPDLSGKTLVDVSCQGKGFPRRELYDIKDGWMMAVAPDIEAPVRYYLLMDKAFTKASFRILGGPRFAINSVMMTMFAFSTACKNTVLIHASVTLHGDKAYAFLGKSGTGKSTHSQLWINNIEGCELLNDDNPVIRVADDGEVRIYGTPWSGKTPCYRNLSAPLGAIVDLHQAKKNEIRRMKLAEAYAALYVSVSSYRFMKEMALGQHRTNESLVTTVPCFSLNCLPDADAAWLCYNTVAR